MTSATAAAIVSVAAAIASAFALTVVSAASTAAAVMAMASAAASACMDVLSVKSLCEFLLSRLSYRKHFSFEMESLARHRVVEVHLDCILCHLDDNSRDHSALVAQHRDGVTRYEKIFADFTVYFKCFLRKVKYH